MIECHPITPGEAGRAEWLTWRKPVITASVAGALLTDHPYTTAMHLWAEQRGIEFPPKHENKRMRRGRKLEGLVGEEVAEAKGWLVEPVGAFYVDPDLRLGGTPGFLGLGPTPCQPRRAAGQDRRPGHHRQAMGRGPGAAGMDPVAARHRDDADRRRVSA